MYSDAFFEILRAVQTDDARNHEFQGEWAKQPLTEALIFQDDNTLWNALEKTYTGSFSLLVYGNTPLFSEVHQSMKALRARLVAFDEKEYHSKGAVNLPI